MKILMLLPKEELNMHISTLIVTVASTLKSRKLEERQLGNDQTFNSIHDSFVH